MRGFGRPIPEEEDDNGPSPWKHKDIHSNLKASPFSAESEQTHKSSILSSRSLIRGMFGGSPDIPVMLGGPEQPKKTTALFSKMEKVHPVPRVFDLSGISFKDSDPLQEPEEGLYTTHFQSPNKQLKDLAPKIINPQKLNFSDVQDEPKKTEYNPRADAPTPKPSITEQAVPKEYSFKKPQPPKKAAVAAAQPKPPAIESSVTPSYKIQSKVTKPKTQESKTAPTVYTKQKVLSSYEEVKETEAVQKLTQKIDSLGGIKLKEQSHNSVVTEQRIRIQQLEKRYKLIQKRKEAILLEKQKIKNETAALQMLAKEGKAQSKIQIERNQKQGVVVIDERKPKVAAKQIDPIKDPYIERKQDLLKIAEMVSELSQNTRRKTDLSIRMNIIEQEIKQNQIKQQRLLAQQVKRQVQFRQEQLKQITDNFTSSKKKFEQLVQSQSKQAIPRSAISHSFVSSGIRMQEDQGKLISRDFFSSKSESNSMFNRLILAGAFLSLLILVLLHMSV